MLKSKKSVFSPVPGQFAELETTSAFFLQQLMHVGTCHGIHVSYIIIFKEYEKIGIFSSDLFFIVNITEHYAVPCKTPFFHLKSYLRLFMNACAWTSSSERTTW